VQVHAYRHKRSILSDHSGPSLSSPNSFVFLPANSACGKPQKSYAWIFLLPEGLRAATPQFQLIKMTEAEKWMACVYLAAPLPGNL